MIFLDDAYGLIFFSHCAWVLIVCVVLTPITLTYGVWTHVLKVEHWIWQMLILIQIQLLRELPASLILSGCVSITSLSRLNVFDSCGYQRGIVMVVGICQSRFSCSVVAFRRHLMYWRLFVEGSWEDLVLRTIADSTILSWELLWYLEIICMEWSILNSIENITLFRASWSSIRLLCCITMEKIPTQGRSTASWRRVMFCLLVKQDLLHLLLMYDLGLSSLRWHLVIEYSILFHLLSIDFDVFDVNLAIS